MKLLPGQGIRLRPLPHDFHSVRCSTSHCVKIVHNSKSFLSLGLALGPSYYRHLSLAQASRCSLQLVQVMQHCFLPGLAVKFLSYYFPVRQVKAFFHLPHLSNKKTFYFKHVKSADMFYRPRIQDCQEHRDIMNSTQHYH